MFGTLTYSGNPLFTEFSRLEQELDDLFSSTAPWVGGIRSLPAGTFPAVNVASTDDGVTVYLFAPGINPKTLEISLQQNVLSVNGQREAPVEEGATYYRRERFDGSFRRVITLPEDVDPDKVDASYRDGLVQIRVQRHQSAKPRQIQIQ